MHLADVTAKTATTEIKTWEEMTASLPDGSTATLSAATRLRYNPTFAMGREVYLAGEAKFDVKPSAVRPFIVKTEAAEITVRGTSFTVTGFERAATIVVVHEGVVRVRGRFDDPKVKPKAVVLVAGQRATVIRNN